MKSLSKSKQKHLGEFWCWFEERTQLSKAIGNNYSEGIGLTPIHYEKSAKRFLGGNLGSGGLDCCCVLPSIRAKATTQAGTSSWGSCADISSSKENDVDFGGLV